MATPLFIVDAHGNYTQLPWSHPAYRNMHTDDSEEEHVQMHHHHHERSQLMSTYLSELDWKAIGWGHVSDWVLKPMLTGLLFGMGSYASRYLVHYLMTNYTTSWHVPVQHTIESQTPGAPVSHTPAAQATELAILEAPSVAAEAIAFSAGEIAGPAGLAGASAANGAIEAIEMSSSSQSSHK